MRRQVYTDDFLRGLQTTRAAEGLPFPAFQYFSNVRVDEGVLKRRLGRVYIDTADSSQKAMAFDGTKDYVYVPWHNGNTPPLGVAFTVECAIRPDIWMADEHIVAFAHPTDYPFDIWVETDSAAVTTIRAEYNADTGAAVEVQSSATFSADDELAIQWIRDQSDLLTLNVYNKTTDVWTTDTHDASGTFAGAALTSPGSALYFGRTVAGGYYDGDIDYVRFFNIARTRKDDLWLRWPDPLCDYCVGDWDFKERTGDLVWDRSRFGHHGEMKGTPGEIASFTHATSPVQGIFPYTTRDGQQRIVVVAGGNVYDEEMP